MNNDLTKDSGDSFLSELDVIAQEDAAGLKKAYESYGPSWKQRGGVGAFMMLARKWDRLENRVKKFMPVGKVDLSPEPFKPGTVARGIQRMIAGYDIFSHIAYDERSEGIIDDVRDLRRYLMLVEAEMRARGFKAAHRDNVDAAQAVPNQEPKGLKIHLEEAHLDESTPR